MFCQFIFINTEAGEAPCDCYRHREKRAPKPPEGGFEIFIIWLLRVKSGVFRPYLSAVCIGIAEKTEFIIMEPVKRPVAVICTGKKAPPIPPKGGLKYLLSGCSE